jgi:N-acetylglucosaminyl-diphospho-decaprenol L-rhamnosyltransferase
VTLTIIIVSYNVKYFLEQCLCSVKKAIGANDQLANNSEIFVVDNNSADGSIEYLKPKFPWAQFFINKENNGFAKANNQALSQATGKYILFLNPDTIIAEDSLSICISFLESHPSTGAVGLRMIDGSGIFLKESKRGFPSSRAAFCRLSGLSTLFPRSKFFSAYYLGHISEHENNIVDVLSGAFMLVRKETLDKIAGFDEQFFMYAEDIDLSYRIQLAGYINYYIADTTIIHFKGESTVKDPRYAKLFYKAMNQFMNKHFRSKTPGIFVMLMKTAVWIRSKIAEAFFSVNIKKEKLKPVKSVLTGDMNCVDHLTSLLRQHNKIIVENPADANEIIFCEGDNLSFKKIINDMQEKKGSFFFKIHAANSDSIVGSDSKDSAGEAIGLK